MDKCEHITVDILMPETMTTILRRYFDGSVLVDGEPGERTGTIEVSCCDCGYHRRFSKSQRKPKWVEAAILEIESTGL